MPTISFSLNDLNELTGKKIPIKDIAKLMEFAKADVEELDQKNDELKISLQDTNLPYLWSAEGIARLLKGVLNIETGLPELAVSHGEYKIIVDKNIKKIRPYIAGFVAKGKKIDDYQIKQMIQLQEKLCETFGRKRRKISVGLYSYGKIKFPVYYKAADPEEIKFVPLESEKAMSAKDILENHPTGIEYAFTLEGFDKYPLFIDSNNRVLSFPPIINSNDLGKLAVGDEHIFFECTGVDFNSVMLACNIFAQAFFDRGFEIHSVQVESEDNKYSCPYDFKKQISLSKTEIKSVFGLDLSEAEIKNLLERARYGYDKGVVKVPNYRSDIMHQVDIIEDIGIIYGFDNIETEALRSYTVGEALPIVEVIDKLRDAVAGLGYREVMSPILSNKMTLLENMGIDVDAIGSDIIELKEYMSESFSAVRNWLLPVLMDVLSKNKHSEYPQKIFEQGLVTSNTGNGVFDYEEIAIVTAHSNANFTEIKQVLDYIMRMMGAEYELQETEHGSFIAGRAGKVIVQGKNIGFAGEMHPKILNNFGIEVPVVGLEINLSILLDICGKSKKTWQNL